MCRKEPGQEPDVLSQAGPRGTAVDRASSTGGSPVRTEHDMQWGLVIAGNRGAKAGDHMGPE